MLEWPWSKREKEVIISKDVRKKGTLVHTWWGCKLLQLSREVIQRLLRKVKAELPYDPVIPLLGLYPKEMVARVGVKGKWRQILVRAYKVQIMKVSPEAERDGYSYQHCIVYMAFC